MSRYKLELLVEQAPESPCDYGDQEWKVYSFQSRHRDNKKREDFFVEIELSLRGELPDDETNQPYQPEWEGADADIRLRLSLGLAQILDYSKHGLCNWSTCGAGPYTDDEFRRADGIIIWEHPVDILGYKTVEERTEAIRAFLECYTNWCNGSCYGYRLTDADTGESNGYLGTFYGDDDLFEALNEELHAEDVIVAVEGNAAWLLEHNDLKCPILKDCPYEEEERLG